MRVVLLLFLPLLSACSPRALTQVRAQVRGWSGGAGQVAVLGEDRAALSSARIDAVGRFTLPLPSAESLAPRLLGSLAPQRSLECSSSVRASAPAAGFYLISDLSAAPYGSKAAVRLVNQTASPAGREPQLLDQRVLIYASAPTQVRGEVRCPAPVGRAAGEGSASYALSLRQGWNYAVVHRTQASGGATQSRTESVGDDGFEGWEAVK